jgi:ATP-binding cassette subfamily F protein 3
VERAEARPRESAAAAASRRRSEAEERNRRYRRTRDLRARLARTEAEARQADLELADLSERLADPSTYADPEAVRALIERHNAARDRSDRLAAEWTRLAAALEQLEAEPAVAERGS